MLDEVQVENKKEIWELILHENSLSKYRGELRKNEASVRTALLDIISEHPGFGRALKYECMTGIKKFGAGDCSANVLVYGKSGKIIMLDDFMGNWYTPVSYIRLQTVPRNGIMRVINSGATNAKMLADALREVDMTLKL